MQGSEKNKWIILENLIQARTDTITKTDPALKPRISWNPMVIDDKGMQQIENETNWLLCKFHYNLHVLIFQAYLVNKYRGKNNEVQHTRMMPKGSRHTGYGPKSQHAPTDTLTSSNANSTFEKYGEKPNDLGESESLLEKDIQVGQF